MMRNYVIIIMEFNIFYCCESAMKEYMNILTVWRTAIQNLKSHCYYGIHYYYGRQIFDLAHRSG